MIGITLDKLNKKDWVDIGEATRLLGITRRPFLDKAPGLGIRIRTIPGVKRCKVNRDDLVRVLSALESQESAAVAPGKKGGKEDGSAVERKKGTARQHTQG